jgi:hypothetical protein
MPRCPGRAHYQALAALIDLRKKLLPLRRGRQTLHHISGDGVTFGLPHRLGDRMARWCPGRVFSSIRKSWSR